MTRITYGVLAVFHITLCIGILIWICMCNVFTTHPRRCSTEYHVLWDSSDTEHHFDFEVYKMYGNVVPWFHSQHFVNIYFEHVPSQHFVNIHFERIHSQHFVNIPILNTFLRNTLWTSSWNMFIRNTLLTFILNTCLRNTLLTSILNGFIRNTLLTFISFWLKSFWFKSLSVIVHVDSLPIKTTGKKPPI